VKLCALLIVLLACTSGAPVDAPACPPPIDAAPLSCPPNIWASVCGVLPCSRIDACLPATPSAPEMCLCTIPSVASGPPAIVQCAVL
jgi:hypothetical protein